MAEAHLAATYNRPGFPVVDHYTYAICGDGCLEEGISYEACSFAGANALGKLILLYDDNDITIEGDTDVTFKENVGARFAAQNWQVLHVDLATSPDDVVALSDAIAKAKERTDKPSIIICRTRIGYGLAARRQRKEPRRTARRGKSEKVQRKARLERRRAVRLPERSVRSLRAGCKRGRGKRNAVEKDVRGIRIHLSRTRAAV